MPPRDLSRRTFLAASGSAAVLASAARLHAIENANDRIRVAIVGAGGRGSGLMEEFHQVAKSHNAEIVAVCDVYRPHLEQAASKVEGWFGKAPRKTTRFEEIMAMKDVDAVIVATPDFAHMPVTIAALKAGKDVYCEKPMAIELTSANEALRLARENKRVVQVGTQRRSDGRYIAAAKEMATGSLGYVSRVSSAVHFNHPRWKRSPDELARVTPADVDWEAYALGSQDFPFDPSLLREWQLHKECTNGVAGLWMVHLVDVVCMLTGAKYPKSAVSQGGNFVWKDGRDHTDTFTTVLEYPEGFLFDWTFDLGSDGGLTCIAYGRKGTLDIESLELTIGSGRKAEKKKIPAEQGESHMGNWLSCIRTRKRPNADIEYGHQHSVASIMSALALETGRKQIYDAEKQEIRSL